MKIVLMNSLNLLQERIGDCWSVKMIPFPSTMTIIVGMDKHTPVHSLLGLRYHMFL